MNFKKMSLIILFFSLTACLPDIRNLVPGGDKAEITTKSNKVFTGELILVNEDAIVMQIISDQKSRNTGIYTFPVDNIQSIKIEDYINIKWQGAILGFEVLPIVLLFVSASIAEVESPTGLAILFVPVLLNYAIFAASTPSPPGVEDPFSGEQLNELRKYARFPQGLSENQLNSFLAIHNQGELKTSNQE